MIIAIDGPAGAGKSTIAKKVAEKLGFLYIDTGAMYRALTFGVLDKGIDVADTAKVTQLARVSKIDLIHSPKSGLQVLLDGRDISQDIREPRITNCVSDVAKIKEVREVMLKLQRELGNKKDSVLDGRDIGTVVFPNAERKFFLDAGIDERTRRRHKELLEMGQKVSLEDVAQDLSNRDRIDSTRAFAPLKQAEDALRVDTTNMSIEQVVEEVLNHVGKLKLKS